MKIGKFFAFIALIIVFLLGILLGFNLKSKQDSGEPLDLNPLSRSCQYSGKIYKSGEGFPDTDGCNSCSCNDGKVACTLMACGKSN